MKKILILVGSIMMLSLTACTGTTTSTASNVYMKHPIANNNFSPTLVTSQAIANIMQPADQTQLVHFLNTVNANQTVNWKNDNGDFFEFDSLNISLDEHGWPCRRYKMRVLIRGYEESMPETTACRMDDGNWRAV